ncbi:MAG: hypothetical protein ACYS6K_07385 [Planctomycetota bacterium]|jgi:hypothetical protein
MYEENAGISKAYCLLIMMSAVLILPVDAVALDIHEITIGVSECRLDGVAGATPYEFYCGVKGDDITAVKMTTPAGNVYDLILWPTGQYDWGFDLEDLTLAELSAMFPFGQYIFDFNGGSDSATLNHSGVWPGGFANITYPAHNSYNVPSNLNITWGSCAGFGDAISMALVEVPSDTMVDGQWFVPIGTTTWTVGPLTTGLQHSLDVMVFTGSTPSDQETSNADAFKYYNLFENCNEIFFTTMPAVGTLSGWIFIPPGVPDIGYSLDESDFLYFYSSEPVLNYNINEDVWDTVGPKGLIYANWPFIYESDSGHLWFAYPPASGLWVYHFSTGQWEVLPRIP